MADVSDLVPTLAVVAATAATPTTITGVGFIRAKESDRLGDLAAELAKLGAESPSSADGLRIDPAGRLHGGRARHPPRPPPGDGVRRARRRRRRHRGRRPRRRVEELAGLLGRPDRDPGRRERCPGGRHDLPRWSAVPPADPIAACRVVAAFDVDGTLTTRDCVVPFLRRVGGTVAARRRARRWPPAASSPALARARPRPAQGASAPRAVFAGRPVGRRRGRRARRSPPTSSARWLRPDTVARLRWHRAQGHRRRARVGVVRRLPAPARPTGLGVDGVRRPPSSTVDDGRPLHRAPCSAATAAARRRSRRLHAWLDEHHGGRGAVELWAYGDSAGRPRAARRRRPRRVGRGDAAGPAVAEWTRRARRRGDCCARPGPSSG